MISRRFAEAERRTGRAAEGARAAADQAIDLARQCDEYRSMADARYLARIFRVLSNPNRLRIYADPEERGDEARRRLGCQLSDVVRSLRSLKIGSPTVSHHVKELVNAELITAEREGKFLVCRINPKTRDLARAMFR